MHLVLDVHRAQKTEAIINMLQDECQTDVTYVPGTLSVLSSQN